MKNISCKDIESQLIKVLGNSETSWLKVSFLLSELDISIFNNLNRKDAIYSTESILRLYLFKRIKGITNYPRLIESLTEDDINNLGFTKDKNNNTLLPTKRTFNRFFHNKEDIKTKLDNIAEKILIIATQNNVVLDVELVKKELRKNRESINKKNKAIKETIKLVKKFIYPKINIKINHNAKFTTKDFLDILVHVAYSHDFCNNGSMTYKELNPNIKIPDSDTIMYHFKKFDDIKKIELMFKNIFDFVFNFVKKEYNMLKNRQFDIAIDIHKVPYYGKYINPNYIKGGVAEGIGTRQFFHFITCAIVTPGGRFTIDAIPMSPFDNLETLVERLIKRAKSKIKIRHCYMDRGFDRTEIINVMNRNNIKFIMPKVRSPTVKKWLDKGEDCKSRIIKNFKIGNTTTNLVLVNDENGIKRAFSTNLDIPEQLTHYLFRFYKFRWGIETSYRQLDHDFLARTTSRNFHIRLFYFLFSVCLYNLWILINICVSLNIYGKLSEKPIITAKLFAIILYKIKEEYEYLDPSG